jgi:hypothetical protein
MASQAPKHKTSDEEADVPVSVQVLPHAIPQSLVVTYRSGKKAELKTKEEVLKEFPLAQVVFFSLSKKSLVLLHKSGMASFAYAGVSVEFLVIGSKLGEALVKTKLF